MKVIYFKQSIGNKKQDNSKFYKELERIKKECKSSKGEWNGDWYDTTYTMKDNTKIIYKENMELGIPTSITYLEGGEKNGIS